MDAQQKLHKKQTTTFDYEKEMEQALSTIFRNLRGMEEMRFRTTSVKGDSSPEILNTSLQDKPTCIELQHAQDVSENQEQVQREQVTTSNVQMKSKRRLPEVPRARGISQ